MEWDRITNSWIVTTEEANGIKEMGLAAIEASEIEPDMITLRSLGRKAVRPEILDPEATKLAVRLANLSLVRSINVSAGARRIAVSISRQYREKTRTSND